METKSKEESIDLEAIVREWAMTNFENIREKRHAKIQPSSINLKINWKHCKFVYTEPDYATKALKDTMPVSPQILFKTTFENTTAREHEYTFRMEKTTRSSCVVGMQQGVTTGGEVSVSLRTPCDVLQANAGFKREITVNDFHEDCTEEEITWGVDSLIRVPARTRTMAQLVVSEADYESTFSMETRISGRVVVVLHNMDDDDKIITHMEGNICNIAKLIYISQGKEGLKQEGKEIICNTNGSCKFKFGVEQRICVTEYPLD